MDAPRLTTAYLNFGHALDHLMMLIYPMVVIVMAPAFGRTYGDMLALSLGGFIAFGMGSLPAGWLGDRWSRHGMMVVFFIGIGLSVSLVGFVTAPWQIAGALTLVGLFASIYHPVGIAMLIQDQPKVGRLLGVNGVWGNLGVALASLIAGALADLIHWRVAFIIPGALAVVAGIGFAVHVPKFPVGKPPADLSTTPVPRIVMVRVFAILAVASFSGGVIFNTTTIAMPKVFDERLAALTSSTIGIGALVSSVYVIAATAQLCVGWMIDRRPLKAVFVLVAASQAPLLYLAASMRDYAMLGVAVAMMFVVFGQIPINDALVAQYAVDAWRSRIYAIRYVITFGASAISVPLVAYLHDVGGGFASVFATLALFALCTFVAALALPQRGVALPTFRATWAKKSY